MAKSTQTILVIAGILSALFVVALLQSQPERKEKPFVTEEMREAYRNRDTSPVERKKISKPAWTKERWWHDGVFNAGQYQHRAQVRNAPAGEESALATFTCFNLLGANNMFAISYHDGGVGTIGALELRVSVDSGGYYGLVPEFNDGVRVVATAPHTLVREMRSGKVLRVVVNDSIAGWRSFYFSLNGSSAAISKVISGCG